MASEKRWPETPAEVAQATLDAIDADNRAFNMDVWVLFGPDRSHGMLVPEDRPSQCGTTLCLAGFVAHATGWTIESFRRVTKGGVVRDMQSVATSELGIDYNTARHLFYTSEEEAYEGLKVIADGGQLP
jgi:hypothetical protein